MDKFINEQPLLEEEEDSLFEEVEEETFGDAAVAVPLACHHHTHGYDNTEEEESEE